MASASPLAGVSGPIQDYGPDSGGRIKGLTVVKPIVIGNWAKHFGKKREDDGHTHQWTVYLKPYPNEDYSSFIKKVQFKLHDSYTNPNRIVNSPPYEVSETGWGEFEIAIKIHFVDPVERPVTVYHVLKLFGNGNDGDQPPAPNQKIQKVVSESYDEIVFLEPTRFMKSLFDSIVPLTDGEYKHETDFEEKKRVSLAKIAAARQQVKGEIQELRARLGLSRETIEQFKAKLAEAQAAQQQAQGTEKAKGRKEGSPGSTRGNKGAPSTKGDNVKM